MIPPPGAKQSLDDRPLTDRQPASTADRLASGGGMIVLGIETSCDETAASVFQGPNQVLSNVVASSLSLHHLYGGVVPELASRRHAEVMDAVVKESLDRAGLSLSQVDLIAVTVGPGLVGTLLIGVTFAKTLAFALEKPLMGISHLEAHLYAPFLEHPKLEFPLLSLIVSGGHTLLVHVRALDQYEVLGTTFDDAAGEAFDKVAKLLGLGYPGGPMIDQWAAQGNPEAIRFPRPMIFGQSLDFSFSGLKTAVLYLVKGYGARGALREEWTRHRTADLAASFQEAVVDVLVQKSLRALERTGLSRLALGGGVAANSRLRSRLEAASRERGFDLFLPSRAMCTDNAAMVAGLAHARAQAKLGGRPLEANPRLKI